MEGGPASRATRYERAQNDVKMRETDLLVSEQSVTHAGAAHQAGGGEPRRARGYDLNKVRMVSPIDGIVTRRNIEEGETAVVGTMNNAGTVLLTIADMSRDRDRDRSGRDGHSVHHASASRPRSTIDAIPDKTLPGTRDRGRQQPDPDDRRRGHRPRDQLQGRRARSTARCRTCARASPARPMITTATRQKAIGVPIQAMTVRELVVDDEGPDREAATPRRRRVRAAPARRARPTLKPGQTRKEIEGVFVVAGRQGRVRPRQDRHRRREVLRGARGPEGGRRGHHRARSPRCGP